MKSLPGKQGQHWRRIVLVGVLAAALTLLPALIKAAKPRASRTSTVEIKDDVILLHPGTKLSKPDRKALNEVLSMYDKSLYKIETYRAGKVTRTMGQLSDALIDKTIAEEAAQAKTSGNSNHTLQIMAATSSQQLLAGSTSAEQQAPEAIPSASTNPQHIQRGTPTPAPSAMPSASTNPQRIPRGTPTPAPSAMPSASTNPQRIPRGTPTPAPSAMPSASTNPQRIQGGTPAPPAPSASTNPPKPYAGAGDKAARELIEQLKPILEKYSSKK